MSAASPREIVTRFITEVLNHKHLDLLDQLVASDFVEQVPFPGQGPGRDGLKSVLHAFNSAFPDIHWHVEETVAENDKVVTRFTLTGTHAGEFLGIPATHKKIRVWGVVIDRVQNAQMVESRILIDTPSLMAQLGK